MRDTLRVTAEPVADDRAFRCSVGAADEPMAGSAAVATSYLLVEHAGPWGRKALAESRLPEHVRHGLAEAADQVGVRVQLIRRPGRPGASTSFRVFATYADPARPWTATALLDDPERLLDLDLAALAAGTVPTGFVPHDGPLHLVCTNGRRDLCCAEQGRPIVTALAEAYPEETWETTHVGGHRFAGAMVLLPHGLSYGRLDPDVAVDVVARSLDGDLVPAYLRGRSAYPGAVQAAELAALGRLGSTRVDAVTVVRVVDESVVDGDARRVVAVTFAHASGELTVRVAEVPTAAARQSCADLTAKPGTRYEVL